jgi:arylsulfatase A-like enzyme
VFNAGMRGKKASLYEGGHRVPFFVRWPGAGIGGGRDVRGLTRATDVLPTLVELCGLRIDDGLNFDGLSLAPALLNGVEPGRDRWAVVQYGHADQGIWGYTERHSAAVLWQNWRLVNGAELYDLVTDPGQERDVAAEHAGEGLEQAVEGRAARGG